MPAARPAFEFVDAHCHIDLFADPQVAVRDADAQRVFTIAVTNAPFVFAHTEALVGSSAFVRAALGLHPELVASHGQQIDQFRALLDRTEFVGEVGLDYTTNDATVRAAQRRVFAAILDACAASRNKIITIHSRRATKDVLTAIGPRFPGRVILHWFAGSLAELDTAGQAGAYFSVNVAMFDSRSGRALVAAMPRDRVLTESDGPFVRRAGQPTSPSMMRSLTEMLASEWRTSAEEVASVVRANFGTCLRPGSDNG